MATTRKPSETTPVSSSAYAHHKISPIVPSLESQLRWSAYGDKVLKIYRASGLNECETLLATSGYVAPDRDWISASEHSGVPGIGGGGGGGDDDDDDDRGLHHALAKLSDYVRTYGAFHGVITGGNSHCTTFMIALVLSALLDSSTYPQSALTWPLAFPLLPMAASSSRAGGWEATPSMALPNGRRTAITQDQFKFVVQLGYDGRAISTDGQAGTGCVSTSRDGRKPSLVSGRQHLSL